MTVLPNSANATEVPRSAQTLKAREQHSEQTGHTPGPWITIRNTSCTGIYRQGRHKVEEHIAATPEGYASDAPNARLIASAPELLEACKMAETKLRDWGDMEINEIADSLRAAIAKAQGEKS